MFSNKTQENLLFELARQRRSVRRYTGEKVSDDVVREILKIALLAPSSWGRHPVEFVVIRDRATIEAVARCKRMGAGPLPTADVAIVVMADMADCELWIEDAAVASTYILLAAEQFGVGACWIHMRNRQGQRKSADEEIRQILGVPDKFSVLNVVALGQKGEKKSPRTEKDLVWQNVHYEKYGQK
ncbi:nitroreductase family protein [Selenomonas ruminantium]|uniref:nitroreductase family protein n=1 Tax=Selenomonas ruminantium TaxID=971 RepID=UPI0026EC305D|nr:nitroreductase family protein [Selenomonas ruminantium]